MKLYNYQNFLESVEDGYRDLTLRIRSICKSNNIENYTINEDGSIDVDGNVFLPEKDLTKLPIKFRKVSGDFYCYNNQLTSLYGSPIVVGGDFYCYNNKLTSLEGGPKTVGSNFYCYRNKLTTLKGGPEEVGDEYCSFNNNLTDVEGFPELWEGELSISNNPVYEIIKLFPKEKWSKVIYLINDYGAIDGLRVNSYVIEEIFHELGLTPPEIKYIEGYEVI